MRHFLHPVPIAALPFGMPMSSLTGGLVTPSGVSHGALTGGLRAALTAITVAAITAAANRHRLATAGAQVASSGNFHRPSGPMGLDGNARFVTYLACNVACWLRARLRL